MKSKVSNHPQSKNIKNQDSAIKDNQKQFSQILKWSEILFQHLDLYLPATNKLHQQYQFYRVQFIELSQLQILVSKRKQYVQFTCILFDKSTESYIGKTYFSQIFEIQYKSMQKPGIKCNKSIFFYTDLKNMVLKVDVWRLESEKTGKNVEFICKSVYSGNIQIDLSQSRQMGIIQQAINLSETNRFFSKQDYQKQDLASSKIKNNQPIMTYKIVNTHSLTFLHYFIPSHIIIDQFDEIIGLKDRHISQNKQIEMDELSCMRINIKEVNVPLVARKPVFEIAQKKIEAKFNLSGRITNNLKQLRLYFQFHNGWKVISNEIISLKEENNQSMLNSSIKKVQKSSSNLKSSMSKINSTNLNRKYYAQNQRQLKPVFLQKGCVLLIWLEAKVQSKFDIKQGNQRKQKSQVTCLPVAFSILSIIDLTSEQNLKIKLTEGNPYNLQHLSKYICEEKVKNNHNKQNTNSAIMCEFELNLDQAQFGLLDNIEKHKDQIQSLKAQKQRLTHLRRKIKEEKRKKMIQMNQQIPFLQTTQLKSKIFQEKLSRIKSQKQEKQGILLFLKSKVNNLERQALQNQFHLQNNDVNQQDGDPYNQGVKIAQKLPDNFIDYKPQQNNKSLDEGIFVNIFSADYCKKAKAVPKLCSHKFMEQFTITPTYLNIKIKDFHSYCKQFQQYTMLIPNFKGSQQCIEIKLANKEQSDNKSVNIKITSQRKERIGQIVNLLFSSTLPIYLQCDHNKKMMGLCLLQCDSFMQSCEQGDIFFKSLQKTVYFRQQNTLLVKVNLTMSFTQNVSQQKESASQESKIIPQLIPSDGKSSLMNRINRFKQEKGDQIFKNMQVMQKKVQHLKTQNILIHCKRNKQQIIKIKLFNKSNQRQLYTLIILDEDRQHIQKEELRFISTQQAESIKTAIYLDAKEEKFLQLVYCSSRINLNFLHQIREAQINDVNFKKVYNNPHKIKINLVQQFTHIIEHIIEISIIPEYEDNVIFIQKFIGENEDVIFPIPCRDLILKNQDQKVKATATKLTISVPHVQNQVSYVTQFSLMKPLLSDSKVQIVFQNFQFIGLLCQKLEIIGRLWEKIDFLIKIPLSVILNKQKNLPYQINSIIINSRSMHVKIKSKTQFDYITKVIISRKNDQIYVRACISMTQIGKNIYGIQVADQNNVIFYRIGIYCNLAFPTLASQQIINIKIPKDNIDLPQPFVYTNQKGKSITFQAKSLRPNLLRFKNEKMRLDKKDQWKIQLIFDWVNIKLEIIEDQKQQLQLLMGIKGDEFIEYILFKCKLSN